MTEIVAPFAQFFGTDGSPLNNGAIYIGAANLDAQSNPIPVYWDDALTIPAIQPIRTLNGYPSRNGTPAKLYASQDAYSISVRTSKNTFVYSNSSQSTILSVANGGTGASDAATARTNLGLGSIATQNANSVAITGGSITGITDLAVADGGTGASDAATARTNLGLGSMATQAASSVAITGGTVAVNSGTAAAPSMSFSGDTDTGMFSPGANRIQFATNGVACQEIASDGSRSSVIPGGSTLLPEFQCRAWVNFNGTGTVAIRASGNVSSITDNGTGDYTVNFTTNMPDANYAVAGINGHTSGGGAVRLADNVAPTVSSVRFNTMNNTGTTPIDVNFATIVIVR